MSWRPAPWYALLVSQHVPIDGTRLRALARAAQRWGAVTLYEAGKVAAEWVSAFRRPRC
jgi:hypothetical protein